MNGSWDINPLALKCTVPVPVTLLLRYPYLWSLRPYAGGLSLDNWAWNTLEIILSERGEGRWQVCAHDCCLHVRENMTCPRMTLSIHVPSNSLYSVGTELACGLCNVTMKPHGKGTHLWTFRSAFCLASFSSSSLGRKLLGWHDLYVSLCFYCVPFRLVYPEKPQCSATPLLAAGTPTSLHLSFGCSVPLVPI